MAAEPVGRWPEENRSCKKVFLQLRFFVCRSCGKKMLRQQHRTAERRKKGFNLFCARLLFVCAASRFAKPRSFLKKVLIVAVRSCGCGVLIRGLRNLETSCERNVFGTFRVYEKYQKYTRGLRTSGLRGRFKALPEVILQKFPRHVSKSVLPAKRRRKGFESVRKGYCSADARPMFF